MMAALKLTLSKFGTFCFNVYSIMIAYEWNTKASRLRTFIGHITDDDLSSTSDLLFFNQHRIFHRYTESCVCVTLIAIF